VLENQYKGEKKMSIWDNWEILYHNFTHGKIQVWVTYNEGENSVEYLDHWLYDFIDTLLLTHQRKQYFLDLVKRNNDLEKSEKILLDCIRKKLID
jgi:hypothetical protein